MTEKNRIISALGESRLLLPALLNAALAAGEQLAYLFSLLGLARERAASRTPDYRIFCRS